MSVLPSSPAPLPPKRPGTQRLVLGTLITVTALLVLWSCGKDFYHNYRLSTAAVDQFHQRLNQGDFESIYGDATDDFRRAATRADEIKFFEMVHQKMGISEKMSTQGFHINWQNGHKFVNQVYDTQFVLGQAQESFVWNIAQDQAHLQSYRVTSPNLR
jgi:hypothetical protein